MILLFHPKMNHVTIEFGCKIWILIKTMLEITFVTGLKKKRHQLLQSVYILLEYIRIDV